MTIITPYRISVADAVLADLKARRRNTSWPEAELINDLSRGAPLKWIQVICQYWQRSTIGGAARRSRSIRAFLTSSYRPH